MKLATKFVPIIFFFFLQGCANPVGGNAWPVQTYTYGCQTGMIPFEPACLIQVNGKFEYRGEFEACRMSVFNFTTALDDFYQCSDRALKSAFDQLLEKVPATYNCYVRYFRNHHEGDSSHDCPRVDIPRFKGSYEVDGLAINLGVPSCVRKNEGADLSPKHSYQLPMCLRDVEIFTNDAIFPQSFGAESAQKQYDTYMRNLERVLQNKARDAVDKFNCLAEGHGFCL